MQLNPKKSPPILAKLPGDPFETKKLNKLVLENREFHKEEIDQHKKYFDEDNINCFSIYVQQR
jgi:hypothetical protein